mgnify:FL=1
MFTFKKGTATITLDDPNPSDSPEMVMGFYSNTYPELTTATIHGPTMKDDAARVHKSLQISPGSM